MADKLYLLLLASGEDFFGEKKSDACTELLMERDWLEVIMITFFSLKIKAKYEQKFNNHFHFNQQQNI